jgi:hypothetical protein
MTDVDAQAIRQAMQVELGALDMLRYGIGNRVASYIATGDPLEALGELAGLPGADKAMGVMNSPQRLRPIYGMLDTLPPAALYRYAQCLASALASLGRAGGSWSSFKGMWPMSATPWPDVLIFNARGLALNYHTADPINPALTADYFEQVLVAGGLPAESLVTAAFLTPVRTGYSTDSQERLPRMTGFMEALVRHRDAARPAFNASAPEQRALALRLLKNADSEVLRHFTLEIAACATENAKVVRTTAAPLLRKLGVTALDALREIAVKGDPGSRALALEAIWEVGEAGEAGALEFVRGRRDQEKARSVLQTIDALEARVAPKGEAGIPPVAELPVVEVRPLPDSVRPAFDLAMRAIDRAIDGAGRREQGQGLKDARPLSAADADALWHFIGGREGELPAELLARLTHWLVTGPAGEAMRQFTREEAVDDVHVVRAFHALKRARVRDKATELDTFLVVALNERYRRRGHPTLVEIEAIIATIGMEPRAVAVAFMGTTWHVVLLGKGWESDDVWPFFARHMEIVRDWLDFRFEGINWPRRAAGFDAVAEFPEPPAVFLARLFELALGSAKGDRALAQGALAKLPDLAARVTAALADGKADVRAAAAHWLARLDHKPAIPALEAALRKDSNDAAIGALLSALESLGASVDWYIDRDKLPAEAKKGLAKGLPPALAWFPWAALPEVRWSDGTVLTPETVQWLLVQATRLKSPEPNALLRRYAGMLAVPDRERLAEFVLDAWIAEDVKTTDLAVPVYARQTGHSAIEAKGLFAVVAACGGRAVAPPASRYLKDYYGTRAGQCKALIAMLAWTEHPSATQLMLSVGHRFRTKGIQDEAQRHAEALAERKGWTLAELADRTIPSAGFDGDGALVLDYGGRKFTGRVGAQYKLELFGEDGKKIAALPEPRQGDDPMLAAEAKKALAAAKKDLKTIVQLQTERLYEALCTQRTWRYEDWETYLNRHAVVRYILQGLVWAEMRDGKAVATFRPLADGTLTDVNDTAFVPAPGARIGLAHDMHLEAPAIAAWQKHLADYEVAAPFPQLGKGVYRLPGALAEESEIADFNQHVVETFALRGRAGKLGYTRGPSEDGGWFYSYRKRFPTLGLEAVIAFSGNSLPEENREVGLKTLAFASLGAATEGVAANATLGSVPAVLVSECYNDVRLMAAEGRGYDPDWKD